jgi:spoIIIJ-associated protein
MIWDRAVSGLVNPVVEDPQIGGAWSDGARRATSTSGEETVMTNGEQGESVKVQDRPTEDSTVAAAVVDQPSEPGISAVSPPASAEVLISPEVVPSGDASVSTAVVTTTQVVDPVASPVAEDAAAGSEVPATPRSSRGSVKDLEEEGEVAADYLEELLDIVDVDGDIDIDVENGRASLAIVAEDGNDRSLRRLVGANGEVLEALQELTRLAVQASTGERSRLMLDVAGHRAHRRKVLTDRAAQACQEVKSSGKALSLEPMSAFERKIVHDVVADAGLESESEGVDPNRHVVILPASS